VYTLRFFLFKMQFVS